MITLACLSPNLQGQGAEMKVPSRVYQHQKYPDHTTPGNHSPALPFISLIMAICFVYVNTVSGWQEVRSPALRCPEDVGWALT